MNGLDLDCLSLSCIGFLCFVKGFCFLPMSAIFRYYPSRLLQWLLQCSNIQRHSRKRYRVLPLGNIRHRGCRSKKAVRYCSPTFTVCSNKALCVCYCSPMTAVFHGGCRQNCR